MRWGGPRARHRGAARAGRGGHQPSARRRSPPRPHARGGARQRACRGQRILPRAVDSRRSMSELTELTIAEAARLLRLHSISASELVTAHVEQIARVDPQVKAFLRFTPELYEQQAEEADRKLKREQGGLLTGIPVAIKDGLCVKGVETTAGSQILRGFKSPDTGTAGGGLVYEGAGLLGVTNCDEFAMRRSAANSGAF